MSKSIKSSLAILVILVFITNYFACPYANASDLLLPAPGVMVPLSPVFNPPILKGIKVHPDNPFQFDFILDLGDERSSPSGGESNLTDQSVKDESSRLIKYFLAGLTTPDKDLWVNLSPYEKDRIIPQNFGLTEMGRDLLAEDYMLKQITASLIYPEDEIGKKFWKRVYQEAQSKYGTTNIPVNTFNKVWIVPEKAIVYENAKSGTAYVVESSLKVMLEQDYLSLQKHSAGIKNDKQLTTSKQLGLLGANIIREIVIPELTKEVNENKNFAQLRQVYNSLILATWYKKKIKDSILSQVYEDKNKVAGINIDDPQEKEKIYQQYLKAFKKGVYNYIKDDIDPLTKASIPRKYFSGGFDLAMSVNLRTITNMDRAELTSQNNLDVVLSQVNMAMKDQAMNVPLMVRFIQAASFKGDEKFFNFHPYDQAMIGAYLRTQMKYAYHHVMADVYRLREIRAHHRSFLSAADYSILIKRALLANRRLYDFKLRQAWESLRKYINPEDPQYDQRLFNEICDMPEADAKHGPLPQWLILELKQPQNAFIFMSSVRIVRQNYLSYVMNPFVFYILKNYIRNEGVNKILIPLDFLAKLPLDNAMNATSVAAMLSRKEKIEDAIKRSEFGNRPMKPTDFKSLGLGKMDTDESDGDFTYSYFSSLGEITDQLFFIEPDHIIYNGPKTKELSVHTRLHILYFEKRPQEAFAVLFNGLKKNLSKEPIIPPVETSEMSVQQLLQPATEPAIKPVEKPRQAGLKPGNGTVVVPDTNGKAVGLPTCEEVEKAVKRFTVFTSGSKTTEGQVLQDLPVVGQPIAIRSPSVSRVEVSRVEVSKHENKGENYVIELLLNNPNGLALEVLSNFKDLEFDYAERQRVGGDIERFNPKENNVLAGFSAKTGTIIHFKNGGVITVRKNYQTKQIEVIVNGFDNPLDIVKKVRKDLRLDSAMAANGGIDLTPSSMNLQTQNSNNGEIKFHLDPAMLTQLQNAPGFTPVIISVKPLKDLAAFLEVH